MTSVMYTDVLLNHESSSIPSHEISLTDGSNSHDQEDSPEKALMQGPCRTHQPPQQREITKVVLPDLFVSFVSQKPKINPYYELVKQESLAWMKKYNT